MNLLPAPCSLLVIDSATSVLSVAVCNKEIFFYREDTTGSKQSESAMILIDEVMKEADLKPADLNGVICMGGPGSFTGLRIGYSIAKGLALALNIPFMAIPLPKNIEIKKHESSYVYYKDGLPLNGGFALELLKIGKKMDFNDNSALFSGPEY